MDARVVFTLRFKEIIYDRHNPETNLNDIPVPKELFS